VWLTTDPSANGHGLCNRRELTPEEKQLFSVRLDQKAFFPDKRAIRFRVVIPSSDRKLVHWPKWGKKRLERWWYDALNKTGSGKANTWWLYWGNIPAEALEAADLASGQLLEGWPAMFRDAKGFQRPPLFDATAALAELERRL